MDFSSVTHYAEYSAEHMNMPNAIEIWNYIKSSFNGVIGAIEGFAKFVPEIIVSALITAFLIRMAVRFIF